ncbi:MAG: hypothetical protein HRU09_07480 [Oligoflexales bacterium]|nr:hypothetical protein [Oligoflexales bacterium]
MVKRIRYDLAKETVIGFCSLIIISLFYYIFNDFLNIEIQKISLKMRDSFAYYLANAIILLSAIAAGRSIRSERLDSRSCGNAFKYLGEDPKVLRDYWLLRIPSKILMFYIPTWFVCFYSLVDWPWVQIAISVIGMLVISLALIFYPNSRGEQSETRASNRSILKNRVYSASSALLIWRLKQLFKRNRLAQVCLLTSTLFSASLLVLPNPIEAFVVFLSLIAGIQVAFALSFQVASDLSYSWIEKNLGVSHEHYLATLFKLSLILGSLSGTTSMIFYGINNILILGNVSWQILLKIFFIGMTPAFMVPNIIFQIDGRRTFIQILNIILASLFVGTAIFANLAGVLLLPLIAYYGVTSQQGRFYRA